MATTTPNFGWPVPTSTDYVKDGALAIETLGDAIDATVFGLGASALTLVKTQTIGTAVSNVVVTNAFSAAYENYKIIVNGGVASTNCYISLQLGASTTGYYSFMIFGQYSGPTVTGSASSNGANFLYAGDGSTSGNYMNADFLNPFLAKYTRFGNSMGYQSALGSGMSSGVHQVATSYTDFTIAPSTGTLTGGTIYVYGYKK
jgi:hypothetical protein